jgi:uncharacterized membrane protein YgcG
MRCESSERTAHLALLATPMTFLAVVVAFAAGVAPAFAVGLSAQDVEEILSYDVGIEVAGGGSMLVTETIRVRALGDEIRRGIYRDFPTSFPRWANLGRIEAPFAVRSVTRDGRSEPFTLEARGGDAGRGGVRIRIGDADVILQPGVYTYVIVYDTDRWIRFGEAQTQLYWNVTGNGWSFPIRSASVRIEIPELRVTPTLESWTGPDGSQDNDASGRWDGASNTVEFATDRALSAYEGLTVRVTFPAGELTPPSEAQRSEWFRLDWGGYLDAGYVVLFVVAIYLLMWRRVGIDPVTGPLRLRTQPPDGYSPAALGFIEERGYDQSQLSAAIVNLAFKGALTIKESGDAWSLHSTEGDPEGLSREEAILYESLLGDRDMIELQRTRHSELRKAIKAFRRSLEKRLEREYFANNRLWFLAGLVASIVGLAALAWRWRYLIEPPALFLGVWLTGWTVGVATFAWRIALLYRTAVAGTHPLAWIAAVGLTLFALPFFAAEIVVSVILSTMVPFHIVLAAISLGGTNILFYHLLERPTLKGRGILDQISGFRAYLEGADGAAAADGRTGVDAPGAVQHFERFLPYAIALGIEDRWTEAFGDALAPTADQSTPGIMPWYHHDRSSFTTAGLTFALGATLASTMSVASSPPSSSGSGGGGGFSGGGSSGGGGGGGGGGGW